MLYTLHPRSSMTEKRVDSKDVIINYLNELPKDKRFFILSKLKKINYNVNSMKIVMEMMKSF